VAGLVLVLAWYAVVWGIVRNLSGSAAGASLYAVSLPLAQDFALRFQERIARARARMRAYFLFRRDPALQQRLLAERAWLREESRSLERAVTANRASLTADG